MPFPWTIGSNVSRQEKRFCRVGKRTCARWHYQLRSGTVLPEVGRGEAEMTLRAIWLQYQFLCDLLLVYSPSNEELQKKYGALLS